MNHHTPTQNTFQHFTRQFRHISRRIFLNQCFQGVFETFSIPSLHIGQRLEEHELRQQIRQRILGTDIAIITTNGDRIFRQVTCIGRLVDRILHLVHHPDIIFVIRIGNRNRIIRFRESRNQLILISSSERLVSGTKSHQINLVVAFQKVTMLRETAFQFLKGFGCQRDILEFVLINHSHVIETIFYDNIGSLDIFGCQRKLLNVILTCFRVIGSSRFQSGLERIGSQFAHLSFGSILSFVCHILIKSGHFFLTSTPVIFQRTPSPFTLESCFSLRYCLRVIEIETGTSGCRR